MCRLFGGERRGADYGDFGGGKNDCICYGYSIEIRNRKRITFNEIRDQVNKAEARATVGQVPLAISYNVGMRDMDGIVSMSLQSFLDFFVSPNVIDKEISE